MQGHWVDFIIVAIMGLSILTGLFRGFVKEFVALCIWVIAMWLAWNHSGSIAPMLEHWIKEPSMRTIIAFVIVLVSTLITGGIVNAVLSFILKRTGLSGTDRTLGMVFGFLRGICIVSLIITGIQLTSLPVNLYAKESVLYSRFDPMVGWMQSYVPDFIQKVKKIDVHEHLASPENSVTFLDDELAKPE